MLCSRDMSPGVLYEGWSLKLRDTIPTSPRLSSPTEQVRRDTFAETAVGKQKISSLKRGRDSHHALTPLGPGLHLEQLRGKVKVSWHTLCPGELRGQRTGGRLLFALRICKIEEQSSHFNPIHLEALDAGYCQREQLPRAYFL